MHSHTALAEGRRRGCAGRRRRARRYGQSRRRGRVRSLHVGGAVLQYQGPRGAVAQLVAHLHGMEGVRGSNPLSSTQVKGRFTVREPAFLIFWQQETAATVTRASRHRGRARLDHQRRGRPWPELQPLEALGEDVRGDPGIWPSRSLNRCGPPSSASTTSSVYRSPTLASASASGDEPFSRSAMSGS